MNPTIEYYDDDDKDVEPKDEKDSSTGEFTNAVPQNVVEDPNKKPDVFTKEQFRRILQKIKEQASENGSDVVVRIIPINPSNI